MSEYEFEVAEDFTTSHFYYVRAGTRQEALVKVLSNEYDYVLTGDLRPKRSINVRDVRRLGRVITPAAADDAARQS